MAHPGPSGSGVVTEISSEESHDAELAPLRNVHEFVGDQVCPLFMPATHEHEPAQRHGRHTRLEPRDHHDASAPGVDGIDVGVSRPRVFGERAANHRTV